MFHTNTLQKSECDCDSHPEVTFPSCQEETPNLDQLANIESLLTDLHSFINEPPEPEPEIEHTISTIDIRPQTLAHGFRFIRVARERELNVDYHIDDDDQMHVSISLEGDNTGKAIHIAREIIMQVAQEMEDGTDFQV